MTSTPSMPAIESSSGLVTCDSITSAEAPGSARAHGDHRLVDPRVLAHRQAVDTTPAPTSTTSSDITVANTGRRIEISGSCIGQRSCQTQADAPVRAVPATTRQPLAAARRCGALAGGASSTTRTGMPSPRISARLARGDHRCRPRRRPSSDLDLARHGARRSSLRRAARLVSWSGPSTSLTTNCRPPCGTSASSGTTRAFSRTPNTMRDAREHAGAQLACRVVDARAHQQRAAVGIEQRVDRLDAAA